MPDQIKPISKISKLREQAGLTQRELSFLIGVTENTIQNWEKGRAGVEQIERIIKLCRVLDCELEDLLEYVADSEPKPKARSFEELRALTDLTKPRKSAKHQSNQSRNT